MKKDRREYFKEWHKKHLGYRKEYNRIYHQDFFVKKMLKLNTRCNSKNRFHHKKGIKNFLNAKDIKFLWFRDKAYLLKEPSIDRIDPKGNYTLENCRFIEFRENCRQGGLNRWQSRKQLNFI